MGFAKAFNYSKLDALTQNISKPMGLLWLFCGVALPLVAGLFLARMEAWWWLGGLALVASQTVIIASWPDAKFGTIANLILLLPVLAGAVEALPGGYAKRYQAAVKGALLEPLAGQMLTEADLKPLPKPVAAYLRYCGVVGKPKVRNFRAVFTGEFRNGLDAPWMGFRSEQVNTLGPPMRAFLMDASMRGLPVRGFHYFAGGKASMQIKVASLVQVVDAKGPKMDQGETVTFFNDLCVMAPAALADPGRIRWESLSPSSVRAHYTLNAITINADLYFGKDGALIDFVSNDRFLSADGKEYRSVPWSTPIHGYREIAGRKVADSAELIWKMPEGDFCYGKFKLVSMEYDLP